MLTVRFITIGTLKEAYLKDAVSEYQKRLSGFCKVEEVNLKEVRLSDRPSESEIKSALEAEGKAILERGHSILKPGGIVPRIPDELTPEEKLSRLFAVINALPGE